MLLEGILKKIFGDPNEKEIKNIRVIVDKINSLEKDMESLSSANLAAKTSEFKVRLQKGETLDDILPEAFAVVREASRRVTGMRHFDVQLIGGVVLHRGKIAEMRTGEGKTLVATAPVYLNALTGKGVHVVTVNDYLARRDSEDMGRIYKFLGLSVGLIVHDMDFPDRKAAYAADITYGTNNEFGFDYLRDNMVVDENQMVQRELNYCIVDEVDSILIDEARTPLIISGPGEKSTELYQVLARVVANMEEGEDYTVDEKQKQVAPTEKGIAKAEKMLGIGNLYDNEHGVDYSHQIMCALKAKALMHRDRDYVVKDGQVIIVDEFTGRLMFGRRFSEGLHQARRHRLHQNHHHVAAARFAYGCHLTAHHATAVHRSRYAQRLAGKTHCLGIGHEMQVAVLLAHVVESTGKEVEGGIDAELVEKRVVAIVCLADFNGVVAHTAPDAEEAEEHHTY